LGLLVLIFGGALAAMSVIAGHQLGYIDDTMNSSTTARISAAVFILT